MTKILTLIILIVVTADVVSAAPDPQNTVEIEVQAGDSLYRIVRLHFPDQSADWNRIAAEIVRQNPDAFRNGDPGSLRVGTTLLVKGVSKDSPPKPPPDVSISPSATPSAANADLPAAQPQARISQRHSLAVIGEIAELSGKPEAIDINNEQRTLTVGASIYRGDALLAEGNDTARVIMNDNAEFLLRPYSRFVIDEYSFIEAQPASSRSVVTVLKGGFRAITGLIGRHNPGAARFRTAVATIGIRGTDFGIRLCAGTECSLPDTGPFEPGAYSGVLDGEITLANDAGITPVARGEFMRTVALDKAPEPAPEAARLIFSDSELSSLEPPEHKPLNFLQWLRYKFGSRDQAS